MCQCIGCNSGCVLKYKQVFTPSCTEKSFENLDCTQCVRRPRYYERMFSLTIFQNFDADVTCCYSSSSFGKSLTSSESTSWQSVTRTSHLSSTPATTPSENSSWRVSANRVMTPRVRAMTLTPRKVHNSRSGSSYMYMFHVFGQYSSIVLQAKIFALFEYITDGFFIQHTCRIRLHEPLSCSYLDSAL